MDPLSIGLMLGGTALSGIGGAMDQAAVNKSNRQQTMADILDMRNNDAYEAAMAKRWSDYQRQIAKYTSAGIDQDTAEAAARNDVLDQEVGRQSGYAAENKGVNDALIGGFGAEAQNGARAVSEASRGAFLEGQSGAGAAPNVTVSSSAPSAVQGEMAKRFQEVADRAKVQTGALAKFGAYGDTMGANDRAVADAGSKIGQVNNFSKGSAALLPSQQDFAGFIARKPIPLPFAQQAPRAPTPTYRPAVRTKAPGSDLLRAGGTLISSIGGSGKAPAYASSILSSLGLSSTGAPTASLGPRNPTGH